MKTPITYLFIAAIAFTTGINGQGANDWKLAKSANGISAYTQKLPHNEIKKVRVEAMVTASLSQLVSTIKDAKMHKQWIYLNDGASIVDSVDAFHWKYYGTTDVPWPATDRDFITEATLVQDSIGFAVTISSQSVPDFLPVQEDHIRIKHVLSKWTLDPIGNGMVHIAFEIEVDPGGNIPIWLINMAVAKGPYKTMEGLIGLINSGRHKNSHLDYIKEFVR